MNNITTQFLGQLLDEAEKVSVRLGQARCPALWPRANGDFLRDIQAERLALIEAHLGGKPATVTLAPEGKPTRTTRLTETSVAIYTPWPDGRCPFGAYDLDSTDGHGPGGLADVRHAVRAVASVADELGLLGGLCVSPSASGSGRHVWIIPPAPCSLDDMAIVLAVLLARAYDTAEADGIESGGAVQCAFRTGSGEIARPGAAGAVEIVPRSTTRPAVGWCIALPREFREPFDDKPMTLDAVPRCDTEAWTAVLRTARPMLPPAPEPRRTAPRFRGGNPQLDGVLAKLSPQSREFLDGTTAQGGRNAAAYATACSLLGFGVPAAEVERLVGDAAARCGLPEAETTAAIRSARRAVPR